MFIASLSIFAKSSNHQRCPLEGDWINTLLHPDNGTLFSAKKEMSCQDLKRHGVNLNAYY